MRYQSTTDVISCTLHKNSEIYILSFNRVLKGLFKTGKMFLEIMYELLINRVVFDGIIILVKPQT
jgi:hypothetical protein